MKAFSLVLTLFAFFSVNPRQFPAVGAHNMSPLKHERSTSEHSWSADYSEIELPS